LVQRIDMIAPQNAGVVSARALAPLGDLLCYSERHRSKDGICLFPKGENVHKEIAAAQKSWHFDCVLRPSMTSRNSEIVEIGAFERV